MAACAAAIAVAVRFPNVAAKAAKVFALGSQRVAFAPRLAIMTVIARLTPGQLVRNSFPATLQRSIVLRLAFSAIIMPAAIGKTFRVGRYK